MRKTKLLALLLAVVMVASMIVVPAYAEGEYTIKLADAEGNTAITAEPGQEIEVYLSIENNPGIVGVGAFVNYDPELSLVYVDKNYQKTLQNVAESVSVDGFSKEYTANPYACNWIMASGTASTGRTDPGGKLITVDGKLAQLVFAAPQTPGTYNITLDISSNERAKGLNLTAATEADGTIAGGAEANTIRLYQDMTVLNCTITVPGEAPAATQCEKHGDATWTEIAEGTWTGGELATGHYKLTGNQTLTSALTVAADVCVDLNGYSITATGTHRVFESTGILAIMDSGETGAISGGKVAEPDEETGYVPESGDHGGNIYAEGDLYIYGGTITGGTAQRGGNIYVRNCTLYMYGGTVTEGNAYRGGNIEVSGTGNIYGGTISNGKANWGASNLAVQSASGGTTENTLNIYNGNIYGGSNKGERGNVVNMYSTLNIYGGTISASSARALQTSGGTSNTGDTYIYGGNITGEVHQGDNCTTNIYNGVFSTDISAYLAECACVFNNTVWQPVENCDCAYTAALAQYGQYITPQTGEHTPAYDGTGYSCLFCSAATAAPGTKEGACAHEGCEGTQTWQPWTGTETDGHYYVTGSFTLPATVSIDGDTLCLDLNGKTVTSAASKRMFKVEAGGTLNLMDNTTGKEGTLQGVQNAYSGAVIHSKGAFNLYGGTIQGGSARSSSNMYGGNVYIGGGTFNMTGGTIKDGKVRTTKSSNISAGGNVYIDSATATISGGIIEGGFADTAGGSSQRGGNISLAGSAQLTISGDAIIRGGQGSHGDNIYMRDDSNVVIMSVASIGAGVDSEVADIHVAAGTLTFYEDPAALQGNWKAYNTTKDAEEATCYVTYAALTDALTAAKAGDTVNLAAEATATTVTLNSVTLNLNGYDLTADAVDATNFGHVIDSTDGQGQLNAEDVLVREDNSMLHVVVDGVSYFENVVFKDGFHPNNSFVAGDPDALYYMYVDKDAEATAIDDALLNGALELSVDVSWTDAAGDHSENFILDNDDLIAAYVEEFDSKMLVVKITGLENVTALDCEVKLVAVEA